MTGSTFEKTIEVSTRNGRICPLPQAWQRLWEMLPDKRRVGSGWEPSLPLILAAWNETSNAEKAARFRLHLEWAFEHGNGDSVAVFLEGLSDIEWLSTKPGE